MGKELVPRYSMRNLQPRKDRAAAIIGPILMGKRDRTIAGFYDRAGATPRLHTVLSPVGTTTFRLTSSESILFPNSTNLQNQPKRVARLDPLYRVRAMFVPDDGMELVAVDYKGAEAVLVAAEMQDWQYLDDLLGGVDTHRKHAVHFYGVAAEEVTPLQRDTAKNVTYASFYGALPPTVARTLNKDADTTGVYISQQDVARLRLKLLSLHPLELWWQSLADELSRNNGVLRNCFGFRRRLRVCNPAERVKAAASSLPQSTVAWLINQSIIQWYKSAVAGVQLLHQIT